MILEQGLVTHLLADAGLSALVADRIYEDVLPQSPILPALVWQRISNPFDHSQDGANALKNPRIQFSCWSTRRLEAIEVANALRSALDGYSGTMGSVTTPAVFAENEFDMYDPTTNLRRVLIDFVIFYVEV